MKFSQSNKNFKETPDPVVDFLATKLGSFSPNSHLAHRSKNMTLLEKTYSLRYSDNYNPTSEPQNSLVTNVALSYPDQNRFFQRGEPPLRVAHARLILSLETSPFPIGG